MPLILGSEECSVDAADVLVILGMGSIENTASKISPIITCLFVTVEKYLSRRCVVIPATIRETVPAFSYDVT